MACARKERASADRTRTVVAHDCDHSAGFTGAGNDLMRVRCRLGRGNRGLPRPSTGEVLPTWDEALTAPPSRWLPEAPSAFHSMVETVDSEHVVFAWRGPVKIGEATEVTKLTG